MADTTATAALIAAGILFVIACVDLVLNWSATAATKEAIKKAAEVAQATNATEATLQAQSAVDFKGAWEALASLATALKDLDRSSRLFVLSLAFLAAAVLAAGAGEVSAAIASGSS